MSRTLMIWRPFFQLPPPLISTVIPVSLSAFFRKTTVIRPFFSLKAFFEGSCHDQATKILTANIGCRLYAHPKKVPVILLGLIAIDRIQAVAQNILSFHSLQINSRFQPFLQKIHKPPDLG